MFFGLSRSKEKEIAPNTKTSWVGWPYYSRASGDRTRALAVRNIHYILTLECIPEVYVLHQKVTHTTQTPQDQ